MSSLPIWQVSPEKQPSHWHVKSLQEPGTGTHCPPLEQGCETHGLISDNYNKENEIVWKVNILLAIIICIFIDNHDSLILIL